MVCGVVHNRQNVGMQEADEADVGLGDVPSASDDATIEARAIALLCMHPDWTNKKLAAKVPCHPKTLSKPNMKNFKAARRALASGREEYRHGPKPDRRRRPSNINPHVPDDE
jgi:hypothetical protein